MAPVEFRSEGKSNTFARDTEREFEACSLAVHARDPLPRACTRLGCFTVATHRLERSDGARPWFGCEVHAPEMAKALAIGLSGAQSGTAWVADEPIGVSA